MITSGVACWLDYLEFEGHAMYSPQTYKYRAVDAVVPWLLRSCGVQTVRPATHLSLPLALQLCLLVPLPVCLSRRDRLAAGAGLVHGRLESVEVLELELCLCRLCDSCHLRLTPQAPSSTS
eukprot:768426-Hanusia_phi.AAC.4